MKEYKHLTINEREEIAVLRAKGLGIRAIGREINRHHSTISRELNKTKGEYRAIKSQAVYESNRINSKRNYIFEEDTEARDYVEYKLSVDRWLPDEIANRCKLEGLYNFSTSTLYRAINYGIVNIDIEKVLKFKGKRSRTKKDDKRGQIPNRKFLDERPEEANTREEIGHWEGDLVISKGRKGGLLTLVDRHSRYPIVEKVKDKSAASIVKAFKRALKGIPKEYLKTITVDNGKEFAGFKEVERELSVSIYFCAPYSPWEKGSNENFNGVLRQFYPKKTNFKEVSKKSLLRTVELIRKRPRKILGYFTSNEIFWEKVKWCA
jgi:IS30 family transposase